MISILCNWAYVTVTAFLVGFAVMQPIAKKAQYRIAHPTSYLAGGLCVLTVYAQVFSLFYKVGLLAVLIMSGAAVVSFFVNRKEIVKVLSGKEIKIPVGELIAAAVLVLVLAYGTSRGYMAYDTALYHAQTIRWMEEYGTVKGLALLQTRFGYNSAAFPLSALFSLSWALKGSMHALSGYFVLLMALPCLRIYKAVGRKKFLPGDFVRLGALYYMTLVLTELVAPASDFFATAAVFYTVIVYADLVDGQETNPIPYAFLSLWALNAVTYKLSAGFMAMLFILPLVLLVRKKQWGTIALFIGLGLCIVCPMLIRGYVLSGWPLYPSTFLSFGHPAWQVPADVAVYDAKEIQAWGRGTQFLPGFQATFAEWIGPWFTSQTIVNRVFLAAGVVGIAATIVAGIAKALTVAAGKQTPAGKQRLFEILSRLLLCFCLAASFILWFAGAPLVRYGYAVVILPGVVSFGTIWSLMTGNPESQESAGTGSKEDRKKPGNQVRAVCDLVIIGLAVLVCLYKSVAVGREAARYIKEPFYVTAQPYEEFEVEAYEAEGHIFYRPVEGDRTGYECFPAAPLTYEGGFGGESLRDGFRR